MKPVVRLTASATRALPRQLLLALCFIYALFGLFGRDPWKNEDAAGFGVMWTMAKGGLHDWLLPNLVGKPITSDGPLGYWLGALLIRASDASNGWIDATDASRIGTSVLFWATCIFIWYGAYLLGRRPEVQPFKYVFGGEPEPRDYGRTLADGALLVLLACFGLAERGHETTPQLAQFSAISLLVYGIVRGIDKPWQGGILWGAGLAALTLAGNPVLGAVMPLGTAGLWLVTAEVRNPRFLIGVPVAAALMALWPLAALHVAGDDARWFFKQWWYNSLSDYSGPLGTVLLYAAKNLSLYAWPAWPLAIWAWISWKGLRRRPHIAVPLAAALPLLALVILQNQHTNRMYILLLPPLALLASFALPTLKRGAINAFDWFAVLSFSILGIFVWLVWLASLTGFPHPLARNLARLVPGYEPHFSAFMFVCATAVTLSWLAIVRWRISRQPQVLWRSVVLSSAGTTLMWVLLMTLWLPFVNYSRTYRDVAQQIAAHLPADYQCISPVRLGDAQIASLAYFGHMNFAFDGDCDLILRQDGAGFDAPSPELHYAWRLIWEGRRVADRDEHIRLYERIDRSHVRRHRAASR